MHRLCTGYEQGSGCQDGIADRLSTRCLQVSGTRAGAPFIPRRRTSRRGIAQEAAGIRAVGSVRPGGVDALPRAGTPWRASWRPVRLCARASPPPERPGDDDWPERPREGQEDKPPRRKHGVSFGMYAAAPPSPLVLVGVVRERQRERGRHQVRRGRHGHDNGIHHVVYPSAPAWRPGWAGRASIVPQSLQGAPQYGQRPSVGGVRLVIVDIVTVPRPPR